MNDGKSIGLGSPRLFGFKTPTAAGRGPESTRVKAGIRQ
jgi:hypothetical protein